jgi:hypothetical protein
MIRRVVVVLAVLIALLPVPAQAGSPGWIVDCLPGHRAPDDPIVHPHHEGAAHMHQFFGARDAGAHSTYDSMRAGGTTCALADDTAGYWVPELYQNGKPVPISTGHNGLGVYYRDNNLSSSTRVQPTPADLRVVAGNAAATSESQNPQLGKAIYWGCGEGGTGKLKTPPSSCKDLVVLHVGFPNCWDGVLTHRNDSAHLAYPKDSKCPSAFPIALPRVIMRIEYMTPGTSAGPITLSSGPVHTMHGDFWQTWEMNRFTDLVERCLNQNRSCGTFEF